MSNEHAELKDVFVHGDRYSLLAAITIDGYIANHVVPGSFEFYSFVAEVICFLSLQLSLFTKTIPSFLR
jgi:hypothetical protein